MSKKRLTPEQFIERLLGDDPKPFSPELNRGEQNSVCVNVRLTLDEEELVRKSADKLGTSPGGYIRLLLARALGEPGS